MRIVITGSIAYDYIMSFPGQFKDHILVDKLDSLSLSYLAGSEIDYIDDLMTASFKIRNPNATASCGCGTSFSV